MVHSERSRILIVDDLPERHELAVLLAQEQGFEVLVRHPVELEDGDLHDVDLVCVDEYLDEEWASEVARRAEGVVALRNEDGLAVAAALRSRARLDVGGGKPGFGVAMLTGDLDRLSVGLPTLHQESLTAAQHDLEWVFRFEVGAEATLPRMFELARAVRSTLPFVSTFGDDAGAEWLALPEADWALTAVAQIEDCRPPAHELAQSTGGRSYLRWLAQRVLPYPSFLLDADYSANLLGITSASFLDLSQAEAFLPFASQYGGPLGGAFLGPRWWRAALQQLLLDAGSSQWEPSRDRAEALREYFRMDLEPLTSDEAVVICAADGTIVSIDGEARDSVRIQIDGWPVYADEAWARIADVAGDSRLQRLVAFDDRTRLEPVL